MFDTMLVVMPLMLSPGPANLVAFFLSTRHPAARLLPFLLGIVCVYVLVSMGLGLLAKQISNAAPSAMLAVQVIGGAFIIYLGVQLARRTKHNAKDVAPTFFNGVAMQCFNPKYPGVVFAVFAKRHTEPTLSVAAAISLVGAVGLLSYTAAGAFVRTRDVTSGNFAKVDLVAGGSLCAVGLWFIVDAFLNISM